MLSAIRIATSRVAVRMSTKKMSTCTALYTNSMYRSVTQQQQHNLQKQLPTTSYVVQYFSANPPLFLDAAEVTERIMSVVKKFDQVHSEKVTPETKFATDLGLDSLDIVEVVMAIEDEFAIEIPDQEADKILSIADAVNYIASHPMAK